MNQLSGSDRTTDRIRVFLIDDQSILRAAFRSLLTRDARIEVVGDSGDARAALEQIAQTLPDVVLLDISMPGLSGLDAIGPIRAANPGVHVLMLTHHEGESFVDQAMGAGADGYLSKDSDPSELSLAITTVYGGRTYLSPKVAGGVIAKLRDGAPVEVGGGSRVSSLTSREREVFQLLAIGKSNKDIAKALTLTVGTVKKHRENLQRKLDCHSTAELARLAIREGLLQS